MAGCSLGATRHIFIAEAIQGEVEACFENRVLTGLHFEMRGSRLSYKRNLITVPITLTLPGWVRPSFCRMM